MPAPIRIVLGEMPRLMLDIIRDAASRRPDRFEVLAAEPERIAVVDAIRKHRPQAVVVGAEDAAVDETYHGVLLAQPGLRLLALKNDARRGELLWVQTHRRPFGPLSPDELLDALERSVGEAESGDG